MAFLELKTPLDMLEKAKREHARMTAAFEIDHIFNFFVTANHISDYVEKTGAVTKAVLEVLYEHEDMRDCRDLCNKAKHLRLTRRADPITPKWSGAIGCAPIGVLPLGCDGRWELWSDGREVEIAELASRVLLKWEDFFDTNGLSGSENKRSF